VVSWPTLVAAAYRTGVVRGTMCACDVMTARRGEVTDFGLSACWSARLMSG